MWSFFSEARVRWLGVLWCALIIGGLFAARWVRVLPSVGIVGLFLTSIVYAWQAGPRAERRPLGAVLSLGLVWLLHLATGLLHTSPTDPALWQDLLLESPFLLLPVAFWLLPTWRPAHVAAPAGLLPSSSSRQHHQLPVAPGSR
jgi:O-antigen ligase